jgi:hypothetical protein
MGFIYLKTNDDKYGVKPPLVNSETSEILVPADYLPVEGYFDDHGIFYLNNDMPTEIKRSDFPDIPEVTSKEDYGYIDDYYPCFLMVSIETLKTMGVEMKIGKGWKWDETNRKFDFIECPSENFAWNPFLKNWKTKCEKCRGVLYHDKETGCNLTDHILEEDIFFDGVFCDCDLCPRCKKLITNMGCPDDHRDCR